MLIYIVIIVALIAVIYLSVRSLLDLNKKDENEIKDQPVKLENKEAPEEEAKSDNVNHDVVKVEKKQNSEKENNRGLIQLSEFGFILSFISVAVGFYKMFIYEEYERNAYVGGDSYNFIINANYATGFFVLGLICMVFACSMLIMNEIQKLSK